MRKFSRGYSELSGKNAQKQIKSGNMVRTAENHFVAPHDIVNVQFVVNDICRKRVWARDVFFSRAAFPKSVVSRIPRYNNSVARAWIFFKMRNKLAQLIPTEVMSPAVSVGGRDSTVFFSKIFPNAGKFVDKIIRVTASDYKPYHFSNKKSNWNFPERQERIAVVKFKVYTRQYFEPMPRPLVIFVRACVHYATQDFLILTVKLGHFLFFNFDTPPYHLILPMLLKNQH